MGGWQGRRSSSLTAGRLTEERGGGQGQGSEPTRGPSHARARDRRARKRRRGGCSNLRKEQGKKKLSAEVVRLY